MSYLYLFRSAERDAFKIGITDNVFRRVKSFEKMDWDASQFYRGARSVVLSAERVLHTLFSKFNVSTPHGDGHSEWFDASAMAEVIRFISENEELLQLSLSEVLDLDEDYENLPGKKARAVTIRLTSEQEDQVKIHAARHKIKKLTPMTQVIFEEGLALMDGMIKKDDLGAGL